PALAVQASESGVASRSDPPYIRSMAAKKKKKAGGKRKAAPKRKAGAKKKKAAKRSARKAAPKKKKAAPAKKKPAAAKPAAPKPAPRAVGAPRPKPGPPMGPGAVAAGARGAEARPAAAPAGGLSGWQRVGRRREHGPHHVAPHPRRLQARGLHGGQARARRPQLPVDRGRGARRGREGRGAVERGRRAHALSLR